MITTSFRGVISLALLVAGAVSRDHRVDDTDSSINYQPPARWSQGAGCAACVIRPDPARTFDGTWHDTTYTPSQSEPLHSITFSFTGTAVSVFNILAGAGSATITHVDLTFELDGDSMEPFTYDPPDGSFQYNQSVFSINGLDSTLHTLVIQARSGVSSVALFDYIVYTAPDPPVTTTTTVSTTITTSASSSISSNIPLSISSTSTSPSSQSAASSTSSPISTLPPLSLPSSTTQSALLPVLSPSQPVALSALSSQPEEHTYSTGAGMQSSSGTQITTSVTPNRQQDASTNNTVPIGAVIGGATGGGMLLLLLLSVLVYLLCVRRERSLRTADETRWPGDDTDKPLADKRSRLRRTRHWTFPDSRKTRTSLLPPPSPSVVAIGDPCSTVSHSSCSSAQSIGETVVAASIVGPPLSAHRPASLGQETTEKEILDADENAPRRLTLPGTPHGSGEPDSGVLERLAELQEEIASIRARQAQVETVALLTGGAPPSYNEV